MLSRTRMEKLMIFFGIFGIGIICFLISQMSDPEEAYLTAVHEQQQKTGEGLLP